LLNRMNDLIDGTEYSYWWDDIYGKKHNVDNLRKNVGMVFKTKSFKDYFENVAYGLRVNGITDKMKLKSVCYHYWTSGALGWGKDKLKKSLNFLEVNNKVMYRSCSNNKSLLFIDGWANIGFGSISTSKLKSLFMS
jgi:phosphate transport system ATP-binding protein